MAVDRYSVEYHLTANGWVVGTSRFFGKVQGDIDDRPERYRGDLGIRSISKINVFS